MDEVHINIKNPLNDLIQTILENGRKLKPIIQRRDPVQVEGVKACKMFVHCIKGENVPVRREFATMAKQLLDLQQRGMNNNMSYQQTTNLDDLMSKVSVNSYVEVEVVYDNKKRDFKCTNTDEGASPKWNELLTFDLISSDKQNGFTTEELQNQDIKIVVKLFDKFKETQQNLGEHDGIYILEENRFLGKIEIPLLTVLQNPDQFDCILRLERPLMLSSY